MGTFKPLLAHGLKQTGDRTFPAFFSRRDAERKAMWKEKKCQINTSSLVWVSEPTEAL